ncbi:MAG: hypothetical protein KGL73_00235 [Burkholderiales bacterium]|nr:hypothetical protein [Burkholderiales bacterium]
MLDFQVHQASGLQALAALRGPQLIAMVSHGDEQSDMPVLWKLCSAYLELGYSVTVLDATKTESPAEPGLIRLLDDGFWPGGNSRPEAAWQILPSARGLQELLTRTSGTGVSWPQLAPLFDDDSVVLVYAKPEILAALLRDSGTRPLLAVSSSKNALLTSYLALKRLLIDGRVEPTIVNVSGIGSTDAENTLPTPVAVNLAECARNFLGYQVRMLRILPQQRGAARDYDLKPLASRLLESGLTLGAKAVTPQAPRTEAFAGTH